MGTKKKAMWALMLCMLVTKCFLCCNGDDNNGNNMGEISSCEGLSYNHYEKTCPQAEHIVRSALSFFFLLDPTSPAALLRLLFHDCQVQGCDASILIDQPSTEMESAKNFGIRKRELIGNIKTMMEAECPKQVSCADVIALAARDAVALSGGPLIGVPLGRKDSTSTPGPDAADSLLPPASTDVGAMLRLFSGMGMTLEQSVAIMGAHTLGATHCSNVLTSLKTVGTRENMDPKFKEIVRLRCPENYPFASSLNSTMFVLNDQTSLAFDSNYYENAIAGRGSLRLDMGIGADQRTRPFAEAFATDRDRFFRAFSSAFVKLSCTKVLTGEKGMIRSRCDRVD